MDDLAGVLKEWRKSEGISQETAARRFDVTLLTYRNWEKGVAEPHFAGLKRIMLVLDWRMVDRDGADVAALNKWSPQTGPDLHPHAA